MSTAQQRENWRKASRKYAAKNREKQRLRVASYREDPDYKERELEAARAKYEPEKTQVKNEKYRKENPAYFAQAAAKRRALERSSICECCTDKDRQEVYEFARIGGLHVDHVEALINGGAHCVTNMQLLTPSLNSQKGTQVDWRL